MRGECPRSVEEGDRQQPVEWSFQSLDLCFVEVDLRLKIGAGELDRLAFQREQGVNFFRPEGPDQVGRELRVIPMLEHVAKRALNETVVRVPPTGQVKPGDEMPALLIFPKSHLAARN